MTLLLIFTTLYFRVLSSGGIDTCPYQNDNCDSKSQSGGATSSDGNTCTSCSSDKQKRIKELEEKIKIQEKKIEETQKKIKKLEKEQAENSTTKESPTIREDERQAASLEFLQAQYELKILEMRRRIKSTESKLTDAMSLVHSTERNESDVRILPIIGWYFSTSNLMYKLFRFMVTYNDAKMKCEILGSRLASTGLFTAEGRSEIQKNVLEGVKENVWIGLNDTAEEGNWVWSDGTRSLNNNTDWDKNEPNNFHGNEDCAVVNHKMNWKIYDVPCIDRSYFICEKN